jgi:hypothetical protein
MAQAMNLSNGGITMRDSKPLRVASYTDFVVGRDYLVRVAGVRSNLRTNSLHVQLEHLDPKQDGRTQEALLTLPVLPLGRTAAFFRACGLEVRDNQEISPRDAVGRLVLMRFESLEGDELVSFRGATKEKRDGQSTR